MSAYLSLPLVDFKIHKSQLKIIAKQRQGPRMCPPTPCLLERADKITHRQIKLPDNRRHASTDVIGLRSNHRFRIFSEIKTVQIFSSRIVLHCFCRQQTDGRTKPEILQQFVGPPLWSIFLQPRMIGGATSEGFWTQPKFRNQTLNYCWNQEITLITWRT